MFLETGRRKKGGGALIIAGSNSPSYADCPTFPNAAFGRSTFAGKPLFRSASQLIMYNEKNIQQ
jgi:hypothetical protein